jgi:F0F1-type ATP synthase assembly protein I
MGLVLVVSTFIGYGLGYLFTHYLHAPDWVAIICLLVGIIAGFVEMIRMAVQISKDQD